MFAMSIGIRMLPRNYSWSPILKAGSVGINCKGVVRGGRGRRYSFRLDTGINGETVVTMGRRMWEIEKSIIDKRNVNAVVRV